jgi:hypothetical protein
MMPSDKESKQYRYPYNLSAGGPAAYALNEGKPSANISPSKLSPIFLGKPT